MLSLCPTTREVDRRPVSHWSTAGILLALLLSSIGYGQDQQTPADAGQPRDGGVEQPPTDPVDPAQIVTRFEASLEFDRLVEEENFEAAAGVGDRLLSLTREEFGAISPETADAHSVVAEAQAGNGDHEAAEQNYLLAIDIYGEIDGAFSENLVRPMVGLGDSYHDDGRFLNAVSAYNEARTVNRRVFGLLHASQISILDRMTRTYLAMNEYEQADAQQRAALTLVERRHEPYAAETLNAIYKYARWLRDRRRYTQERDQYGRAIRVIRDHFGEDSTELVKPLRETGNSFRKQGAAVSQGINGLNAALELLEAQEQPEQRALAEVLRDIGDWETAFSRMGADGAAYRRAWQHMGNIEGGDELRSEWFGGIEYVLNEPLSLRGLSSALDAEQGFVLAKFDLDETGRTANVEILESHPPGLKDEAVARHVRQSRFRPHMSDGAIILRRNLALRVIFRYAPSAIDGEENE